MSQGAFFVPAEQISFIISSHLITNNEVAMSQTERKKILVIEDDQAISQLFKAYFLLKNFAVHTESSGSQALKYANCHQPDLVILDLKLPDMNGYEVCKKLRVIYDSWAVPILIVSAMDKPIDQLRGYGFGADAYLTKPFQFEEIEDTINFLLGGNILNQ